MPTREEPDNLGDGMTTLKVLDLVPSVRRYNTGLLLMSIKGKRGAISQFLARIS
jgi:hypothetical protein